jgi:hypothetical protein
VDWIDPNTWKSLTELIGDWKTILVSITAIGGSIGIIFGWFLKPLRWFQARTKSKAEQKGISLSFVPNDLRCHWGEAKLNDQSGIYLKGRWHVTNSSESDVMILKARLGKYASRFAWVATRHPEDERPIFGNYPIRSHGMSEVSADFTFFTPIGRAPKPIISVGAGTVACPRTETPTLLCS